jgi:hypothetical protein
MNFPFLATAGGDGHGWQGIGPARSLSDLVFDSETVGERGQISTISTRMRE